MNSLEMKMIDTLIDLKENHCVIGVKCEFEAEGTRLEEALRLKEVATRAGLDLTIKIGGCEALKDMYEARTIGVSSIVAPMVESSYALQKFIRASRLAFPDDERKETEFYINVETITGFNNFDSMLALPEAAELTGIVFGRGDMSCSMGLERDDVNTDKMLYMANSIAERCITHSKKLIIGGGVSESSLDFFKKLPQNSLNKFETRKIIFDAPKVIFDANAEKSILKAVGFELMWIKNKRDFYGMIYNEDNQRLAMLESRYCQYIKESGLL